MKLHCDKCDKYLGDYLYGKGGVVERARITGGSAISLPDIICFDCAGYEPKIKVVEGIKLIK